MAARSAKASRDRVRDELLAAGLSVPAVAAGMADRFGLRPRLAWRYALDWPQWRLAQEFRVANPGLAVTESRISEWENWPYGGTKPTPEALAGLAVAFGHGCVPADLVDALDLTHLSRAEQALFARRGASATSPALVGNATNGLDFHPDWSLSLGEAMTMWQQDVNRRDFLLGAGFSASAYTIPAFRWLTAPPAADPVGTGARVVGTPDVELVHQMLRAFREVDNRFGGGQVRDAVVRFLSTDVAALLQGRYDRAVGSRLLSVAAQVTQLAAWTSYDIGRHATAQRYLTQALRMAAAAEDRPLGAEILAAMSHQAAYLRHGMEAVDLARAAERAATDSGIGALAAEAAVLEAQGHAVLGDQAASAVALDRAERAFDKAENTATPQWLGYFDQSYLAAKFGQCFTALGRGDLALPFAQRSLDMDSAYARGRQFNLALLARAHHQAGEVEQAAEVAVDAAKAAVELKSERSRDYLRDLASRLAPHAGLTTVQEFMSLLSPAQAS